MLFCNATAAHCEDTNILGQGQLTSNGVATVKLRLGIGSHRIRAEFQGTRIYARNASSAQDLTVTGKFTTSTGILAQGLNFTGTVTSYGIPAAGSAAAGTVSFLDVTNGNSLLASASLNAGSTDLLFTQASMFAIGGIQALYEVGTTVGDFNGDGIPDLAIGNTHDGMMRILLGNGDGTFTAKSTLSIGGNSSAVGDFNGDGILDIVTTNGSSTSVTVLLGNGDGTFTYKSHPSVNNPSAVAVGDFNGDGIPDLVVGSYDHYAGISTANILLGNGDGTFTLQSTPRVDLRTRLVRGGGLQRRRNPGSGCVFV